MNTDDYGSGELPESPKVAKIAEIEKARPFGLPDSCLIFSVSPRLRGEFWSCGGRDARRKDMNFGIN